MIAYLSTSHDLTMLRLSNIILAFKPDKIVQTYTEVHSFDSDNYLLTVSGENAAGEIERTALNLRSIFSSLHTSADFLAQITEVQLEQ